MQKAPSQDANVLGAVILALVIHAFFLIFIYLSDVGMFSFSKNKQTPNVDLEFIELTEELLAVQQSPEDDLQALLEKYKNVTSKEGTESTNKVQSYNINKAQIDELVKKEVLELEKKEFENLDDGTEIKKYESQVDRSSDKGKEASKSSSKSKNSEESYSAATSNYDFSRDHEIRRDPAYKCKLYGQIIVQITVDQNGKVVGSKAIAGDLEKDCLKIESENYAKTWKFAAKHDAPKHEKGTITFTFMPQ